MPLMPSMLDDPNAQPQAPAPTDVTPGEGMPSMAPTPPPAPPTNEFAPPGQPIPEQEMHHAKMKNIDDRTAAVSSGIIGLDWHDPDYAQKLAALHAQQGALHSERAHEERTNPWGSMGNHPGIMGKIGHGLAVAGNIAGNALIPGVMSSIPGSQANLNAREAGGQAETAEAGREGLEASQASALDNKEAKPPGVDETVWKSMKAIAMKQGTPEDMANVKAFHDLTMSKQKALTPGQAGTPEQQLIAAKQALREAKTPEEQQAAQQTIGDIEGMLSGKHTGTPEQQFLDDFKKQHPNAAPEEGIRAYAAASQKPERPQNGDARADRSYQYNQNRLDKVRAPIDQLATRFSRLTDTLNQQSPQADALIAPELMTVMAGGQGSGLRINEAEINRITGGRSGWENLRGAVQHWATDPTAARSITPEQDKQIRSLIQLVGQKITAKQQIIDASQEELLNADDPESHRRIVAEAHRKLDAIDGPTQRGEAKGKSLSLAAVQKAATDHNISLEEAKKQALAAGYTIQ